MCCLAMLVLVVSILNIPVSLVSKEKVHKDRHHGKFDSGTVLVEDLNVTFSAPVVYVYMYECLPDTLLHAYQHTVSALNHVKVSYH